MFVIVFIFVLKKPYFLGFFIVVQNNFFLWICLFKLNFKLKLFSLLLNKFLFINFISIDKNYNILMSYIT